MKLSDDHVRDMEGTVQQHTEEIVRRHPAQPAVPVCLRWLPCVRVPLCVWLFHARCPTSRVNSLHMLWEAEYVSSGLLAIYLQV
eukprot:m.1090205 g.1090205  ORF g.1090205 m.1090205 type:complete len:84 (+) comp24286_c1_seq89:3206-3457(+)